MCMSWLLLLLILITLFKWFPLWFFLDLGNDFRNFSIHWSTNCYLEQGLNLGLKFSVSRATSNVPIKATLPKHCDQAYGTPLNALSQVDFLLYYNNNMLSLSIVISKLKHNFAYYSVFAIVHANNKLWVNLIYIYMYVCIVAFGLI